MIVAFAIVAALLVLTPGVGTAFLTSTVINHGRRAGYQAALGMVLGGVLYALAAALGTTALIATFPRALTWIAIGGGAFITWLGLRGLLAVLRRRPQSARVAEAPATQGAFVTTGVVVALGNAPLPLFYLVVVPQYVPRTMQPLTGALLLSALHLLMAGTWMTTLVTVLGRLVDVLRRPRVFITMQVLTAIALILLGARSIRGAL